MNSHHRGSVSVPGWQYSVKLCRPLVREEVAFYTCHWEDVSVGSAPGVSRTCPWHFPLLPSSVTVVSWLR